MARQKKEIQEDPDADTSSGKMKVLDNILNRNKDHHYAFDNNIDYVTYIFDPLFDKLWIIFQNFFIFKLTSTSLIIIRI